MLKTRCVFAVGFVLFAARMVFAQGDPAVIAKIIDEGKNRNQAWEHLTYLSEQIGPRLTGSSRLLQANAWTRDKFASFGLSNAHLYKWGDVPVAFDRGPSYVRMTKPVALDFEFTARSWTAGTNGPVTGVVLRQPKTMEELVALGDKLKGAWILGKARAPQRRGPRPGAGGGAAATTARGDSTPPAATADGAAVPRNVVSSEAPATAAPPSNSDGKPTDAKPAGDTAPSAPPAADGPGRGARGPRGEDGAAARNAEADLEAEIVKALNEAGIAGRITPSSSELVVTSGARNWREMDFKNLPTEVGITIRRSDYDAINSRLADGEEVVIEADLQHHFVEGPFPLYNVVAEIRGTEWPEQIVIVSGHLDSWDGPGSQGTQDNGVGTSTTLETARILMAAGARPKRTIRFCLWTGEEQGLLGSRAYADGLTDEEKANISAVIVDDGGTNYDGGLVCIESMAPMLRAATAAVNEAFPDMPVEIIVRDRMPRGGGSDHASFNRINIPGFFWEEKGSGGREGKNYNYVHHTQYDTPRFAVPEYLVQSSTASAVTAYNLAMADSLLPRYVPPTETDSPSVPESTAEFTPVDGPVTGTWSLAVQREGAPSESRSTLTLEMAADNRVRGTYASRLGEGKISKAAFDPATKKLTLNFTSEMIGTMKFSATVNGDEMTGTLGNEDGDFSMPFKATREKAAPATSPAAATSGSSVGGGN